jgi:heparanase 1
MVEGASMAGLLLIWLLLLLSPSVSALEKCSNITNLCANVADDVLVVEVDARSILSTTDEAFLCATLDWWPPDKCDYGTCAWGQASLLNLDLANPLLEKSLRALYPFRIRLGGTLQDHIVYDVGLSPGQSCLPIVKDETYMFGFREGCLSMERWVALNTLFAKTGTLVAFGLNALYNRQQVSNAWGPWDSSNARALIDFSVKQNIQIDAWELGNELSGSGVGTSVSAQQYAEDMSDLRLIVDTLYEGFTRRPLLVAPDGFFDRQWISTFINAAGPGVLDVVTRHIYNLGPGSSTDLVEKILNPQYLNNELGSFQATKDILESTAPSTQAWIGEAGGAYNSGRHLVTDAFVFSFWYLDQLGMAASFNNKVYCRQTLIGGNYGLLNTTTFHPNPDMYSALLWKNLMGTRVLATSLEGYPQLRAYAHCQKTTVAGGLTLLLINLSNSTVNVAANLVSHSKDEPMSHGDKKTKSQLIPKKFKVSKSSKSRFEYHLSAPNQDLHSQTALLNGIPLEVTYSGDLPNLDPIVKENSSPILVGPLSIVFVVLPDAHVPICKVQSSTK